MRFNLRWLLKYVDLDLPVGELLDGLTMAGLEVEEYIDLGLRSGRIIIGEIVDIQPHSSSKKLSVCLVRTSENPEAKPLRVVCGAPGLKVGSKYPLALPGAVLRDGRVIEKSTIKGEPSEGMLCSGPELGWNDDPSGLLLLDGALPIGKPFDGLIEVAVTPNRPDCLAVVGVARDIAAYLRRPFHPPKFRFPETAGTTASSARVEVEDKEGCPRYTARIVRNVKVRPSPPWLARAIEAAGLRPINNIVDVTNYVLTEMGHPLHAFDLDTLAEHTIVVRSARDGERLVTLDGIGRTLTGQDLLITDPSKPIALAGIMGGENTEITEKTAGVLLESAYFDPIRIRRTRRRLGIQTDASFRFERGTDRENVHVALNRAAQLIREVAGGEITKGIIDAVAGRPKLQPLTLRLPRTDDILGVDLDGSEIADILVRIGCEMTHSDHERMIVVPPSHRVDLLREIDLIEEIGRMHGYDKIEATLPYVPARPAALDPAQSLRRQLAALLADQGLTEVTTYSFTDPASIERSRQTTEGMVELVNPLAANQSVLRTSLVPSILETIAHNHRHGTVDLAIYEVADSYHWKGGTGDPYGEQGHAVVALSGRRPGHWGQAPAPWDFFDIKGIVERVLAGLGIAADRIERVRKDELHPGRAAAFYEKDTLLAVFGQLHPEVGEAWELRSDVFLAEVDLDNLVPHVEARRRYRPVPQFPAIVRDMALVADCQVSAGQIEAALREAAGPLLESIHLFDVYEGEHVAAGKRSLAFSLTFRASDRTLTDQEVNEIHGRLVKQATKKHGAQLRTA